MEKIIIYDATNDEQTLSYTKEEIENFTKEEAAKFVLTLGKPNVKLYEILLQKILEIKYNCNESTKKSWYDYYTSSIFMEVLNLNMHINLMESTPNEHFVNPNEYNPISLCTDYVYNVINLNMEDNKNGDSRYGKN